MQPCVSPPSPFSLPLDPTPFPHTSLTVSSCIYRVYSITPKDMQILNSTVKIASRGRQGLWFWMQNQSDIFVAETLPPRPFEAVLLS